MQRSWALRPCAAVRLEQAIASALSHPNSRVLVSPVPFLVIQSLGISGKQRGRIELFFASNQGAIQPENANSTEKNLQSGGTKCGQHTKQSSAQQSGMRTLDF